MIVLAPANWNEFQHYKDRCPPWVKLHKRLLDDRKFQQLPLASRALAPMLSLLASESMHGHFNGSVEDLAFRLRRPADEIEAGLGPLLEIGWLVRVPDASDSPPGNQQSAMPETEKKAEIETDSENIQSSSQHASDLIAVIVTRDGNKQPFYKRDLPPWQTRYPAVDVAAAFAEMESFTQRHADKRPLKANIAEFIGRWLGKNQHEAPAVSRPNPGQRDPALEKIYRDEKSAAPMPREVRALAQKFKKR